MKRILGKLSILDWVGVLAFGVLVGLMIYSNMRTGMLPNGFLHLAYGFLEGKLDLKWFGTVLDFTVVGGKLYLPQGPLPAILMMPFVYSRKYWQENNAGYLSLVLNLANIGLVFGIAKRVLGDRIKAGWMTLAYVFASPYLGIGMESAVWYQGQLVAATGLLFSLFMYLFRQSLALAGEWHSQLPTP